MQCIQKRILGNQKQRTNKILNLNVLSTLHNDHCFWKLWGNHGKTNVAKARVWFYTKVEGRLDLEWILQPSSFNCRPAPQVCGSCLFTVGGKRLSYYTEKVASSICLPCLDATPCVCSVSMVLALLTTSVSFWFTLNIHNATLRQTLLADAMALKTNMPWWSLCSLLRIVTKKIQVLE